MAIMTHSIDARGWHVWRYADGSFLEFDPSRCAHLKQQAADNGWKQTIGDAGAKSRDPKTGKSATIAEIRESMRDRIETLYSGEWTARTQPVSTLLARAIAALYPAKFPPENNPIRAVREWVASQALATGQDVKVVAANMERSEKVAAKMVELRGPVNVAAADALFASLESTPD